MRKTIRITQIFFYLILTSLLIVNFLLIYQNLELKSKLESFNNPEVKQGDIFDEFDAEDLAGNKEKIEYSESKRIIFFFKPSCEYCKKQMTHWKNLTSNVNQQNYKITVLTTETNIQAIKSYLKEYDIEDWEVLIINLKQAQNAKLLATPITAVVGNNGVVEKVWIGMWQPNDIDSVGKYFAINFSTE